MITISDAIKGAIEAGGRRVSELALAHWLDVLEGLNDADVMAAIRIVSRSVDGRLSAGHVRSIALERAANRAEASRSLWSSRCHAHGDGRGNERYERGPDGFGRIVGRSDRLGDPDRPSPNPTMDWCDRCSYFVLKGQQEAAPPQMDP